MSYLQFVPKELVDALTWLGKKQLSEQLDQSLLNEASRYGTRFVEEVAKVLHIYFRYRPDGPVQDDVAKVRALHLFIASQVLANGQKTLLLSQELCEAFENTEVTLPFHDYRQPYDTMVIELPANYAENRVIEGLPRYPVCITLHHMQDKRMLWIEVVFRNTTTCVHRVGYTPEDVMEDLIRKVVSEDGSADSAGKATVDKVMPLCRIALNAMIAMTYGIDGKKFAPIPQQRQVKKAIQKKAAGKDKFIAHRARLRLAALPSYFQFDQKIKAFDEQPPSPQSPSNTSGSPKKPHWRKGHWRQQAVGQGRVERELRWIRPMLIRADRFGGDVKDTTTTYTT